MNDNVKEEIDKLLVFYNAVLKTRSDYAEQLKAVNNLLKCPVCPMGSARIVTEFGNFQIKCDHCGFHVGRDESLKKLLERWTAVVDTIETNKTENE